MTPFFVSDGDAKGYEMMHQIKYGVLSTLFYLNHYLSVPYGVRLGVNPYDLLRTGTTFQSISKSCKEDYLARIRTLMSPTVHTPYAYDYNNEFLNNANSRTNFGCSINNI